MLGSCIVRYGVSVLRHTRSRSRGPGMGGGPRCSLGPASPTRVRARWLVRGRFRARGPMSSKEHFRGPAPHGTATGGPPAPDGLEQPSPFTSPVSDVPCRRRRHRSAGSMADGAAGPPFTFPRGNDSDGLSPARSRSLGADPCGCDASRPERLRSCHARPGVAPSAAPGLPRLTESSPSAAHRFHPGLPPLRVSARRGERPVASAGPSARLSARRAFLRAMRRTDLCHLTASYEHPCLTGSRSVASFRARFPGYRLPSRQSDSLRRAAPGSFCGPRRALSSRRGVCGRASGIPVASPAGSRSARA